MTYAFGTDGVDRYVRVYRKENAPCEDELAARRRGDPWNDAIKQQLIEKVCYFYTLFFFGNSFFDRGDLIRLSKKLKVPKRSLKNLPQILIIRINTRI